MSKQNQRAWLIQKQTTAPQEKNQQPLGKSANAQIECNDSFAININNMSAKKSLTTVSNDGSSLRTNLTGQTDQDSSIWLIKIFLN